MEGINVIKTILEKCKTTEKMQVLEKTGFFDSVKQKSYLGADIKPNEHVYYAFFVKIIKGKKLNGYIKMPTICVELSAIKENEFDKIDTFYYIDRMEGVIPRLKECVPYGS